MIEQRPPRSKLAVAFYAIGVIALLASLVPAFWLGIMGFAGRRSGLGGVFGPLGVTLLIQPVLFILSGGVVQILADIRWALLKNREGNDA